MSKQRERIKIKAGSGFGKSKAAYERREQEERARAAGEKLIYSPTVCSGGDDYREGPSMLYEEARRKRKVGDLLTAFAGAPGTGRVVHRITRIDETGVWGVEIENNIRELDPEETR